MKVKIYRCENRNTGILVPTSKHIEIKPRRWIENGYSHPMYYTKPIAFENKNVFYLHDFGNKDENSRGIHISLTFLEKHRFLFMQKDHWLQKEENIRYIINILFLTCGVFIGILNYLKK